MAHIQLTEGLMSAYLDAINGNDLSFIREVPYTLRTPKNLALKDLRDSGRHLANVLGIPFVDTTVVL